MSGKNLCFVRETTILHDELMETTDETKTKEALIGLIGTVGELESNYKIMSRRLDRLEDNFKKLQEGIKAIAEKIGVVL